MVQQASADSSQPAPHTRAINVNLIRQVARVAPSPRPRVVAVGRFDGVHLGHQRVLARILERAAAIGGEAWVVLTRVPGPPPALTGLREQIGLLGAAGIRQVALARGVSQSSIASAAAVGAVELVSAALVTGLPSGLRLDLVQAVAVDGAAVDAATIRAALAAADLARAARLLGRPHAVSGRVIHGHHRGGPLGIPTANIRVHGVQLPPDGVYAVRARVDGRDLRGVANIGFNPTFANRDRSVETHLLDFDADLYGHRLAIGFIARLRGEQKFPGVDALLAQIRLDIAAARQVFAGDGC